MKPKPFQRPRIDVDASGIKREWQWVSPDKLSIGDTLADFGTISRINSNQSFQYTNTLIVDDIESGKAPIIGYEVFGQNGQRTIFEPSDVCHAYTRVSA